MGPSADGGNPGHPLPWRLRLLLQPSTPAMTPVHSCQCLKTVTLHPISTHESPILSGFQHPSPYIPASVTCLPTFCVCAPFLNELFPYCWISTSSAILDTHLVGYEICKHSFLSLWLVFPSSWQGFCLSEQRLLILVLGLRICYLILVPRFPLQVSLEMFIILLFIFRFTIHFELYLAKVWGLHRGSCFCACRCLSVRARLLRRFPFLRCAAFVLLESWMGWLCSWGFFTSGFPTLFYQFTYLYFCWYQIAWSSLALR